jgi:hypothetical protein
MASAGQAGSRTGTTLPAHLPSQFRELLLASADVGGPTVELLESRLQLLDHPVIARILEGRSPEAIEDMVSSVPHGTVDEFGFLKNTLELLLARADIGESEAAFPSRLQQIADGTLIEIRTSPTLLDDRDGQEFVRLDTQLLELLLARAEIGEGGITSGDRSGNTLVPGGVRPTIGPTLSEVLKKPPIDTQDPHDPELLELLLAGANVGEGETALTSVPVDIVDIDTLEITITPTQATEPLLGRGLVLVHLNLLFGSNKRYFLSLVILHPAVGLILAPFTSNPKGISGSSKFNYNKVYEYVNSCSIAASSLHFRVLVVFQ